MIQFRKCLLLVAVTIFSLHIAQVFNGKQEWRNTSTLSLLSRNIASKNNDQQNPGSELIRHNEFACPKWEKWRSSYINCLLTSYQSISTEKLWQFWRKKHRQCLLANGITDAASAFRLVKNTNEDDMKIVVQPPDGYGDQSCVVVTLGVGGDIKAEKKMKAANPMCRFFGADPIERFGQIYSAVGTYFEIAVGANKGVFNSKVKNGPGYSDYTVSAVPVIDLVSFLLNRVNESVIDHLWMDNEGPEYELLPLMTRGGILDKNNITICQINAELHWPPERYNTNAMKFGNMIMSFARNSDYIVLALNTPGGHQRPFFLNAFNSYCVKKFLGDWCA